uniref:hypothetical protein n=1 Tax=uncultured Roseovarius sp. TaxID=293344 RepID=UPI0025E8A7A8
MTTLSASVAALCVPNKHEDQVPASGIYDDISRRDLTERISHKLLLYLADKSAGHSPIAKRLQSIRATSKYHQLLEALAEAAIYYSTVYLEEDGPKAWVFPGNGKRGRPKQLEVSILFHDVGEAISTALVANVGIWQRDHDQGCVVLIARMVAASV